MELIFVSRTGRLNKIDTGWLVLLFILSICLTLITIGVFGGYVLGSRWTQGNVPQGYILGQPNAGYKGKTTKLQKGLNFELARQREMLAQATRNAEVNLDALAVRLGRLQAHATRLNALGARLSEVAGIPLEEFDFDSEPALGGAAERSTLKQNTLPDFLGSLRKLSRSLENEEAKLAAIEPLILRSKSQAAVKPDLPPMANGWISSRFGRRTNPFDGRREFHKGLDFAGPSGSKITAVAAGIVTWSGRNSNYGNMVVIDHGNGYVTRYAHNKSNRVKMGDKVAKGEVIALMGSTGSSTGPHVHFEVLRDGHAVDPQPFIQTERS